MELIKAMCKCGKPHDNWPDESDGMLCQMCWEAQCGKSWWEMVNALMSAQPSDVQEGSKEGSKS
jgi:hypothetical protein